MDAQTIEHEVGIDSFLTIQKGIGGKLRIKPEDFQVTEQTTIDTHNVNGKHLIIKITAKNWDTHLLVRALANKLHISQKRINFAGTKDKRALSTQYMSLYNISEEHLSTIHISDTQITPICRSTSPLRIGQLVGNQFNIIIRDLPSTLTNQTIQHLIEPIQSLGGFPNYYGIQRFGIIRPVTHLIGYHIIRGKFKNAVMSYIANPHSSESEKIYSLRKQLQVTHDFSSALKTYPRTLSFERSMLHHLVNHPDDYIGALQTLPKNLLTLFVNAYQSYLFNKILSLRLSNNQPLNQALKGDIIYPIRNHAIEKTSIRATSSNIDKINTQLKKHNAVVTGLLVGYNTDYATGEMGKLEQHIIKQEHLHPNDFIIPEVPSLSSQGTRRPLLSFISNISWSLEEYTEQKKSKLLDLFFTLPKGSYATVFLRELMKSNDITDY